jgi:hypothetical protein
LSVLNTNVGSQSASHCRLAIVPDFVAVPGSAKAAEGKYQVIDEGDPGMGPRGEWDISSLEVLDSLANWESTQSKETGVSNHPRNPS